MVGEIMTERTRGRWALWIASAILLGMAIAGLRQQWSLLNPVVDPASGPEAARLAARTSQYFAFIVIASAFTRILPALYGLAACGWFPRLPLMRFGLALMSAVLAVRAVSSLVHVIGALASRPSLSSPSVVFSLAALFAAVLYVMGTTLRWEQLESGRRAKP
jgi:hypothetical protein